MLVLGQEALLGSPVQPPGPALLVDCRGSHRVKLSPTACQHPHVTLKVHISLQIGAYTGLKYSSANNMGLGFLRC